MCRTVAGHIVLFLNPFWEITIESGVLDRLYTSLTFFPGPILLCKSASVRRPALSGWPRQRWRPTISIKQTDRLWSLVSKPRQPGGRADGRTDAPRLSFVVRPSVCLSVVARAPRRDPSFPPSPRPPSVQCCSAAAFFFLPRERERARERERERANSFFPNQFCGGSADAAEQRPADVGVDEGRLSKSRLLGIEFRARHRDPRPSREHHSPLPRPPGPLPRSSFVSPSPHNNLKPEPLWGIKSGRVWEGRRGMKAAVAVGRTD